jgi:acetyl-CoA C-acetyltransferase
MWFEGGSTSMTNKFVETETQGRVLWVTINRPEVMNSLHPPCHEELHEVWNNFRDNPDLWIAVLTGKGTKAFSAGNDLKWTAQNQGQLPTPPDSGFGGLTNRFDLNKPVIAMVNGFALGGGFEMALSCDLIIASDSASFALPEPNVGLYAAAGGTQRLIRHLPLKTAMGMMLTAKRISAAEAQSLGLVNEVAAPENLRATTERWVTEILACSPLSIRATKETAMGSLDRPLQESIHPGQYPSVRALFSSEDMIEGPLAFSQKRAPTWKGR